MDGKVLWEKSDAPKAKESSYNGCFDAGEETSGHRNDMLCLCMQRHSPKIQESPNPGLLFAIPRRHIGR